MSEYQGKSYEPVSNYLESSASIIFSATLLRGIRLGLLPKEKYDNGTWTLIDDCAQKKFNKLNLFKIFLFNRRKSPSRVIFNINKYI